MLVMVTELRCVWVAGMLDTHTCSQFSHDSEDDPVFRALEGAVRGLIKHTLLENVY